MKNLLNNKKEIINLKNQNLERYKIRLNQLIQTKSRIESSIKSEDNSNINILINKNDINNNISINNITNNNLINNINFNNNNNNSHSNNLSTNQNTKNNKLTDVDLENSNSIGI